MEAIAALRTLRRRGYSAAVEGGRLKLRGTAKPPEDLEAAILQHRDELVRLVEEEIIVDDRGRARATRRATEHPRHLR